MIYLLGRNEHAAALLPLIEVAGIVDDHTQETAWNGKPVIRSADVPKDATVINCAMSISPVTAARRLCEIGLKNLSYFDFSRDSPPRVPVPAFVSDTRNDFVDNIPRWAVLRTLFADELSNTVLEDLMSYRLTADIRYMRNYTVRLSDQYFEDFIHLDGEVFVDAGGFDGGTTAEFIRRCPNYRKVFLFEPSSKNMEVARRRLSGYRDVEFVEQGLSDTPDTLRFSTGGSASAICEAGTSSIEVTTLDAAVSERVSFIKMDLEGWEIQALAGSREHILRDHPKLAIAVYHRASDFWRVPEYVLGLRQDYDVYLRHYTEGWSETIMYFIPQKGAML